MAYCVRCGVELAPSERVCPLCLTPVVLPGEPLPEAQKPYPEHMEAVSLHIDRRYGAKLALLIISIPLLALLLCDLAINFCISWSAYPIGAGVCLCCWVILPFSQIVHKPYLYMVADFLSAAGYLALIAWRTDGMDWYVALGLPLTLLAGVTVELAVYLARRKRHPALKRASNMALLLAATAVGVEILTDLFVHQTIVLQWSVYSFISLAALAAVLRIVSRSERLKSAIQRRLFL